MATGEGVDEGGAGTQINLALQLVSTHRRGAAMRWPRRRCGDRTAIVPRYSVSYRRSGRVLAGDEGSGIERPFVRDW
jgi:hypothetical protein